MIELRTMEFEIPLISLIFIVMLIIVYASKEKIKSLENKIFSVILLASFLEILIATYVHIVCSLNTVEFIENFYYGLFNFLNKIIAINFGIIFESLFIYILVITYGKEIIKNKLLKKGLLIVNILFMGILLFTNIVIVDAKTVTNVGGSTTILGYLIVALFLVLSIGVTIKNYKKIDQRYLPILTIFVILIISYLGTIFLQGMILYDFAMVILCYLMYFTMENPDMKLLKEIHNAKEISDNANEEKTMFLYNMTQEIRSVIGNIDNEIENIILSDTIELDKEYARNIKTEISNFRMNINDILDVSTMESSNIKIYNSSYNLRLVLKDIVSNYTNICKNKNIEFRTNIEHNIPKLLYGDGINLKTVLKSILDFSIESTVNGYVDFSINTIIKKDIIRLIITIEDSSIGINSKDLEVVKVENEYISLAYKLITLMNGTMSITSNYGSGNKIKVILDQKINLSIGSAVNKYEKILNNKKILLIDDNEASIKIIERLLKGSNIEIDACFNGRDALKRLKTKKKYDLILMDEELKSISGENLLNKIKEIRNFNTRVILLSKDNKYEYSEEYIEMGFDDVIIKPIKKDIIIKKINKI